jgi:hypothetical protein
MIARPTVHKKYMALRLLGKEEIVIPITFHILNQGEGTGGLSALLSYQEEV